ncbi:hypothetical protein SLA2020_107060 [Shorea laevis]
MSSSVCQGLQSCLEPRLIEPRVLWFKPAPSKPTFTTSRDAAPATASHQTKTTFATTAIISGNDYSAKKNRNADLGGWSFLQSLTTAKDSAVNEPGYVHPTVKRSASMLSEKSLEMCTESLGSETGSDVSENSYEIPLLSPETETGNPSKPSQNSKRMHRSNSFPPPLTSMSSSSSVHMRPHREGGRLVLQAVTLPSPHSYLHAERSEGRLRLCLVKDSPPISDNEEESLEEEEEEEAAAAAEDEEEEGYWGGDTGAIVEMVTMKSGWESFQGQAGARKVGVAIEAC